MTVPTNLPASGSEPPRDADSSGFEQLAEPVRRWIWRQGWSELRDIQERSIPAILGGGDVIIAASTASGKTEAAFLPLLSRICENPAPGEGFRAVYVSPLKALINDQFRRLEALCEESEIPVHKWHGDVSGSAKARARKDPAGVLLITPESLEATLVRRGLEAPGYFSKIEAIVIDELHAFIGSERGVQLQSILHRLDIIAGRRIDRIGLSATLGNMRLAAECLRPGHGDEVLLLESKSSGGELKAQIRGYVTTLPRNNTGVSGQDGTEGTNGESREMAAKRAIASHVFENLRGSHNLIFAGARQTVEIYADLLREMSEEDRLPNEFFAHHGSLSKDHREFVEQRMKEGRIPTSAVCTSTLELGIDIGEIESVAQIGAPWLVSGLRQRLGRSGRREGKPAILRVYVEEMEVDADSHPTDSLRMELIQAIAMLRLLVKGWCEPPRDRGMHLSTLVHQILALISQYGGVLARQLFELLCAKGPFSNVSMERFLEILRALGDSETELIEQTPDGTLLLGRQGERLVDHYSFYAVFQTPEEYRIVAGGKSLGQMPVFTILVPGATIIFAGQRWQVTSISERQKVIEVVASKAGVPPKFGGGGGDIHDEVLAEMRAVYMDVQLPPYLDAKAKELLAEGRDSFRQFGLDSIGIIAWVKGCLLFPWVGTVNLETLMLALRAQGINVCRRGLILEIENTEIDEVIGALDELANGPVPDEMELVAHVRPLIREKYDPYLPTSILRHGLAKDRIQRESVPRVAAELIRSGVVRTS